VAFPGRPALHHLQAQAQRDRTSANNRTSTVAASPLARPMSSGSAVRPTSSSGEQPRHLRLSADDFLQEPPEYQLSQSIEEEGAEDVQAGEAL